MFTIKDSFDEVQKCFTDLVGYVYGTNSLSVHFERFEAHMDEMKPLAKQLLDYHEEVYFFGDYIADFSNVTYSKLAKMVLQSIESIEAENEEISKEVDVYLENHEYE